MSNWLSQFEPASFEGAEIIHFHLKEDDNFCIGVELSRYEGFNINIAKLKICTNSIDQMWYFFNDRLIAYNDVATRPDQHECLVRSDDRFIYLTKCDFNDLSQTWSFKSDGRIGNLVTNRFIGTDSKCGDGVIRENSTLEISKFYIPKQNKTNECAFQEWESRRSSPDDIIGRHNPTSRDLWFTIAFFGSVFLFFSIIVILLLRGRSTTPYELHPHPQTSISNGDINDNNGVLSLEVYEVFYTSDEVNTSNSENVIHCNSNDDMTPEQQQQPAHLP